MGSLMSKKLSSKTKPELVVEPATVVGATTAGDCEATSIGNLGSPLRRKHVRNPLFIRNNESIRS